MKPLIFLGSTTAIKTYSGIAIRTGRPVAGIFDSDYHSNTKDIKGIPVIGSEKELLDPSRCEELKSQYDFFIATNWTPWHSNRDRNKRLALIDLVNTCNITCINLIDPTCLIEPDVRLGHGIYIGFSVFIGHETVIGDFSQVGCQTGVGHNSYLGSNTIIHQQVGLGSITTGKNVFIGMWSKIMSDKEDISIGDNAVVNPALYVTRSVQAGEHIKLTKDAIRVNRGLNYI
jgi:acetyltransferase-like isoleucine patch superfamily enzyme